MEVLYPDVIGSGGAPKRIMKPRRRIDGHPGDDSEMPGTGILNLQHGDGQQLKVRSADGGSRPSLSDASTRSSSSSIPQREFAPMTLPPRSSLGPSSALTPPDETVPMAHSKQSLNNLQTKQSAFANTPGTSHRTSNAPEKRRRTSSRGASMPESSISTLSAPVTRTVTGAAASSVPHLDSALGNGNPLVEELVDVLKSRAMPRWREEALDIFFRDFPDEDLDLQVKISENILTHENKAMVFCKMPIRVRQHWVSRLREMHHKAS